MTRRLDLPAPLIAALVLAAAFTLHVRGTLAPLEHVVTEARTRALAHAIESDIVVVEIDSKSLVDLDEWPWPRRHFARLLQQLQRAEPSLVFLDVDLSARTNPRDDALLESVLASWQGAPVLLPMHFEPRPDGRPEIVTRPLPELAAHGSLVAVMLTPDADGMIRAARSGWRLGDDMVPSPFDPESHLPPGTVMPIDYSILPSSFGSVSFSDVVGGRIDPDDLRGKRIFVGATAVELRDIIAVPMHSLLPGIVVQALAAATLDVGALRVPSRGTYFALLALWTVASLALLGRRGWRRDAAILGAGVVLLGALSVYLYAAHRIDIDVVPPAIVLLSMFVVGALRSLDEQTLRAIRYALRLRRRDALLRSIVESTADSIVCVDADGRVRTANAAAARLFGLPSAELGAVGMEQLVPGISRALADDRTALRAAREYLVKRVDGRRVPVEASVSRVGLEDERLFTVILRDITERKAHEREIEYRATHDALTALPNREALYRRLDATLDERGETPPSALLLLDLGRFGEVNDALGHDVGDDLLAEAARRIESAVREPGFVARIGADEFAVLMSPLAAPDAAAEQADLLLEALRSPYLVRGIAIDLGATIGIALAPDHARSGRELLRRADVAMYGAKRRGSPLEHYDRDHDRHTVQRLGMIGELRAALSNGGLALHYQPQVDLRTGRAEAVEALLRWRHPTLGNVRPDEFIALAESSHLIRPLTEWTLHRALADVGALKRRGIDLRVAVNLSARMLQDVSLAAQVESLLGAYSVDASQLELEITESAMMLDPKRARHVVESVHALGVGVSVDDYGTGFSSLGYLRDLPIDALKLDKSFVLGLENREQNRVIVDSTAHLAHALNLVIVAEGVETDWSCDYLARAGYDLLQGYYFSRPLPPEECFAWLAAYNAAPAAPSGLSAAPSGLTALRRAG